MKLIQVSITSSTRGAKQYPMRTSEMCLSLTLGGEATASGENGNYIFRLISLRWTGKSYKGQIAAFSGEEKVASQSFESPKGVYLQETMNKGLRKLATKLDVDLEPVSHLTY